MTSALEEMMDHHARASKKAPVSNAVNVRRSAKSPTSSGKIDEHGPSCFGCEEEKGANWTGAGGMHPEIEEKRPSL